MVVGKPFEVQPCLGAENGGYCAGTTCLSLQVSLWVVYWVMGEDPLGQPFLSKFSAAQKNSFGKFFSDPKVQSAAQLVWSMCSRLSMAD
jgi:hypothetical protein